MKTAHHTKERAMKIYAIIVSVIAICSIIAFLVVFLHAGYHTKILVRLGLKEKTVGTNYALLAWENCLEQMNYDADIVFLGDSITYSGDFATCFPDMDIVNLGYSGDSLVGMTARLPAVEAVTPEKVFLMGGINGLTDVNLTQCVSQYEKLLTALQEALPEAQIYVQSVLPVSREKELSVCHNSTIDAFNRQLQQLAQERKLEYIDLYTLYEKGGQLDPALSEDGIHLKQEAYSDWIETIRPFVEQ